MNIKYDYDEERAKSVEKLVENVIQNAKRLNKKIEATCSYAQKLI